MVIDIPPVYEQYIQQLAQEQGLSVSEYMLSLLPEKQDTTDYLLASPKNAERLMQSMAQAKTGQVLYHGLVDV